MVTIKYFSACYLGPTQTKPARLRITNRVECSTRDFIWDNEVGNSEQAQVSHRFHSPLLTVEMLWYDSIFNLQFFRTIEE